MICKMCVMDDVADSLISFDSNGISNYWNAAMIDKENEYFPNEVGRKKLDQIVEQIKNDGKGKKYDCIIGLSGGLDSSYLALICHKYGLRMLGVHLNDGFDEECGTNNVLNLVKSFNIDLVEIKTDMDQYYALIRAYLRAGVPNLAAAQDNIITSELLALAKKHKIKYFMSGVNFALECILQKGNTITNKDKRNILDIYKKNGDGTAINALKMDSPFQRDLYYKFYGLKTCALLNYVDYNMERAISELHEACGFEYYGGKHYENTFTKFVQQIWLVEKFNVDKRKSHYSSMIASNQMTREEALAKLQQPVISRDERAHIIKDLASRLKMEPNEIENMLKKPGVQHSTYKTSLYLKTKNYLKRILH